jgi:putative addiction module component
MIRNEKLPTIEKLRESVSREEETCLESPAWHEAALRKTAARQQAGKEQPIHWDAAKGELRKRAV